MAYSQKSLFRLRRRLIAAFCLLLFGILLCYTLKTFKTIKEINVDSGEIRIRKTILGFGVSQDIKHTLSSEFLDQHKRIHSDDAAWKIESVRYNIFRGPSTHYLHGGASSSLDNLFLEMGDSGFSNKAILYSLKNALSVIRKHGDFQYRLNGDTSVMFIDRAGNEIVLEEDGGIAALQQDTDRQPNNSQLSDPAE